MRSPVEPLKAEKAEREDLNWISAFWDAPALMERRRAGREEWKKRRGEVGEEKVK